jgi:hypothetical protein
MDDGHNKNDNSKNTTKNFPKVKITLISTNKLRCVHSKLKGANGALFLILLGSLFFFCFKKPM